MELKKGGYVRFKDGEIVKIVGKDIEGRCYIDVKYMDNIFLTELDFLKIVNYSKNIYDLLEDGDLVEIEYYVARYGGRISRIFEVEKLEDDFIAFNNYYMDFTYDLRTHKFKPKNHNPKIKKILSYEQFDENAYSVR